MIRVADKCKMIVTFDTLPESKILDASDILILPNLQKPWTIVFKDVDRTFDLEYSTYCILNRSELCCKHLFFPFLELLLFAGFLVP